jgi:uncharacterized protein
MEFVNDFTVPTDIDTAWATLTDLEKVAPCLPGATLEEVDGETYSGRVKVKVGPITVTYRGTARMVEADADKRFARIDASGKEARGSGTAKADVTAQLTETDDGTLVHVVTDLNVTGKPAQFGRGVMADVGTKIISAFADRLEELVLSDGAAAETAAAETAAEPAPAGSEAAEPAAAGAGSAAPAEEISAEGVPIGGEARATGAAAAAASGPRKIAPDPTREDDALDLMEVAGAATVKRLLPLVAGLAVVGLIIWLLRRR